MFDCPETCNPGARPEPTGPNPFGPGEASPTASFTYPALLPAPCSLAQTCSISPRLFCPAFLVLPHQGSTSQTLPVRALPAVDWAVLSDHTAPEEAVGVAAARIGAALARAAFTDAAPVPLVGSAAARTT